MEKRQPWFTITLPIHVRRRRSSCHMLTLPSPMSTPPNWSPIPPSLATRSWPTSPPLRLPLSPRTMRVSLTHTRRPTPNTAQLFFTPLPARSSSCSQPQAPAQERIPSRSKWPFNALLVMATSGSTRLIHSLLLSLTLPTSVTQQIWHCFVRA